MRCSTTAPSFPFGFQCSSASRKFLNLRGNDAADGVNEVSVLFSEPKIPQLKEFVALVSNPREFQCSSASRKFLNCEGIVVFFVKREVSVLFSEPKIPQYEPDPNPRA